MWDVLHTGLGRLTGHIRQVPKIRHLELFALAAVLWPCTVTVKMFWLMGVPKRVFYWGSLDCENACPQMAVALVKVHSYLRSTSVLIKTHLRHSNMYPVLVLCCFLVLQALATPPACFLSCTSAIAASCTHGHRDLTCICRERDSLVGCLIDLCPYGSFESARDHFLGTCLEHKRAAPTAAKPVSSSNQGVTKLNQGITQQLGISPPVGPPHQAPKRVQQETQKFTTHKVPSTPKAPAKEQPVPATPLTFPQGQMTQWEEEQTTDAEGNIIIIRRPIKATKPAHGVTKNIQKAPVQQKMVEENAPKGPVSGSPYQVSKLSSSRRLLQY